MPSSRSRKMKHLLTISKAGRLRAVSPDALSFAFAEEMELSALCHIAERKTSATRGRTMPTGTGNKSVSLTN